MTDSKKRAGSDKSETNTEKTSQSLSASDRLRELLDKNAASDLLTELKERDMQIGEIGGKVKDVAGQIWLAGLGAYVKVEKEGTKWFDTLVKDGERLEEKTRELVDRQWSFYRDKVDDVRGKVEEVKDMATNSIDRIEKAFDERVASALARLNIPSKNDIDYLNQKIQSLQQELATLKTSAPKASATKTSVKVTNKVTADSKAKAARAKITVESKKVAPTKAAVKQVVSGKGAVEKKPAAKGKVAKSASTKTVTAPVKASTAKAPGAKKPATKKNPAPA